MKQDIFTRIHTLMPDYQYQYHRDWLHCGSVGHVATCD